MTVIIKSNMSPHFGLIAAQEAILKTLIAGNPKLPSPRITGSTSAFSADKTPREYKGEFYSSTSKTPKSYLHIYILPK